MELLYISKKNRPYIFRDREQQKKGKKASSEYKNIYVPPYKEGHTFLKHPTAKVTLENKTHKPNQNSLAAHMAFSKRKDYSELPENGPRAHIKPDLFNKINKLIYLNKKKRTTSPRRFRPKYNDINLEAKKVEFNKKKRSKTGEKKRRIHGERKQQNMTEMMVTSYTRRKWAYSKKERDPSMEKTDSLSFIQINLKDSDLRLNVQRKREAFINKMRKSSNTFYKKKRNFSKEATLDEIKKEYHLLKGDLNVEEEEEYRKSLRRGNYSMEAHLKNKNYDKIISVIKNSRRSSKRKSKLVPNLELKVENIEITEGEEEEKQPFEDDIENVDVFEIFDKEQSFLNLKQERLDQMSLGLEEIRYEIRRVDEVIYF